MNGSPWDIDQLVCEVVRRLRQMDRPGAETRQSIKSSNSSGEETSLILSDRVVSLAVLEGRLAGVEKVMVRNDAVVTPAVRDELKARNIVLAVPDNTRAEVPAAAPVSIAIAVSGFDASSLVRAIAGENAAVKLIEDSDVAAAVRKLVAGLSGARELAVMVTCQPAAALCLANRHPSVRAAFVDSVSMVREAVSTIAANVLVVDARGLSLFQLRNMLRQFIRGGVRKCPPLLQTT